MNGELVNTLTSDGLSLHGLLLRSEMPRNPHADLLIFVHGVGSNFYQSSLVKKTCDLFLRQGISLLTVNTRGHDFVFSGGMSDSSSWMGSANELIQDCVADLEAWSNKAAKLGFQRVLIFGHSLGAIKAIYSQKNKRIQESGEKNLDGTIKGIIAVSPSCLSCSYFLNSHRAEEFQKWLQWSSDQIEAGHSNRLTEVSFPFRLIMSPRTYYDKYGPEEKYNILNLLSEIELPLHLVFGELEVASNNPAFEKLDQRVLPVIGSKSNIHLQTVPNADHYYSGVQGELAQAILDWIHQL